MPYSPFGAPTPKISNQQRVPQRPLSVVDVVVCCTARTDSFTISGTLHKDVVMC